jgi:phage gp36-like protein
MAYCTLDDLKDQISEDELIQLTDDDSTGSVDMDKINGAIASADALIDGYCGKHFSVPFSPTPPIIRDLSVIIAIYKLFARRQGAPDDRRTRYKDAVDFLKGAAKGENTPGIQPVPDPPGEDGYTGASQVSTRDKVFDADTLSKY